MDFFSVSCSMSKIACMNQRICYALLICLFSSCQLPQKKSIDDLEIGERKEVGDEKKGLVMVGIGDSENSADYVRAADLLTEGKNNEAIQVYIELCKKEKPSFKTFAFLGLGSAYLADGQYQEALMSYQKSIKLDSLNVDAIISMGSTYYSMQRFDSAIVYYRKGKMLNANNSSCYWGLAISYDMLGNNKLAKEHAEAFIRMEPNSQYRSMLEKIRDK